MLDIATRVFCPLLDYVYSLWNREGYKLSLEMQKSRKAAVGRQFFSCLNHQFKTLIYEICDER